MENLKEIRRRINSVVKTRQVTSAMKMVSAAKLKKAYDKVLQFRPYADKYKDILLSAYYASIEIENNVYFKKQPLNKVLLIPISSNRGLCGAFNANIIKTLNKSISTNYAKVSLKNIHLITIGKKGHKILHKNHTIFKSDFDILEDISLTNVEVFTEKIIQSYLNGDYNKVEIIYNRFKNAGNQIVTTYPFLPISLDNYDKSKPKTYIYEPNIKHILKSIIPHILKASFYRILLESIASEHGARMTAMHKATDNAGEMIKELKLYYNKARQAAITKEILEIISGANALTG